MRDDIQKAIPRWQFREAYGRDPRMTGEYDIEQCRQMEDSGYVMTCTTCLADDIHGFMVVRKPMPKGPVSCCGRFMSAGVFSDKCDDCPLRERWP